VSQNLAGERNRVVDGPREAIAGLAAGEDQSGLEAVFHAQYERIARVIARVIRDPARAEELAVEVFLKWTRASGVREDNATGWLCRTAVRLGLDELRRQGRRSRYERVVRLVGAVPTPEEIHSSNEEKDRVRRVLASLNGRQAEILLLRGEGLSYPELASTLGLNPASVGTLVSRAQQAFRKEYIERYGKT
jgi:RNA polymerase sigma-70 factor (ECF subfamily)